MMKRIGLGLVVATGLAVMALAACSSDDAAGGAGGGTCGLTCSGTVACDSGDTGTASVSGGACVLTTTTGKSATLKCDKTAALSDPTLGDDTGTWTGSATQVTISGTGYSYSCTITPPAGTGGSGGGTGGSGGATGGSGGSTPGSCGFTSSIPACDTCINSSCASSCSACSSSDACVSLLTCAMPCQTQECVDSCGASYPDGVAPFNAFYTCLGSSCSSSCQ